MRNPRGMGVFAALFAALIISSCGGGSSSSAPSSQDQASIYTVGTDAPLPSVVSCEVTVSGITLNNGSTNVSVLSQPQIESAHRDDYEDTNFIHLGGLSALQGTQPISIRVVGFILVNQTTGQPVMVARSVEEIAS